VEGQGHGGQRMASVVVRRTGSEQTKAPRTPTLSLSAVSEALALCAGMVWSWSSQGSPPKVRPERMLDCCCCLNSLLLQYLIQSCARGGRRIVENMCYEKRRAEACVDPQEKIKDHQNIVTHSGTRSRFGNFAFSRSVACMFGVLAPQYLYLPAYAGTTCWAWNKCWSPKEG
jgi:hypothetical protein